ncbi:MAG: hypothetical protein WA099_05915 [Sulfuricurvum sp.]
MRNKKWGALAIGFLTLLGLSNEAQAMPMFGKQTGLDCTACHLQHMPKLNAVGRSFAASGMTQGKKNSDANSSGMDLYASVMVKAMYEETWDKPSADGLIKDNVTPTAGGEWSVPRTASLYVGGKLSENVGALIDLSYKDAEDNSIQGKVVYAKEIENGYLGAVAYSSASFGPFSGMETYNTGLYKPLRTFDIKKLSNAFQASEIGTGAATGMQIYYDKDKMFTSDDHLFVTGGVYTPLQDNTDMQIRENILPFARVAYEFPVSDFNFVLGGFGIVGGWQVSSSEPLSIERETYGIDFQLEGMIAEKSVSLILSKVLRNEVTYTGIGSNANNPAEYINLRNTAFSAEGEINLTPEIGFKVAYLTFDDRYLYKTQNSHNDVKDIDHAYTVGVDYSFDAYFPMKLAIEHAWAKPSLDSVADYRDFLVSLNILY